MNGRSAFFFISLIAALNLVGFHHGLAAAGSPSKEVIGPSLRIFRFGGPVRDPREQTVLPGTEYDSVRGFGFEPGHPATFASGGLSCAAGDSFFFSTDLPEGNYRVSLQFRGAQGGSKVTVKAELRRLMLEGVELKEGEERTCSFVVNTRTPTIAARPGLLAGEVKLKAPRETTREAWAWDGRLTLEISGQRPILEWMRIERVKVPTIFLLGDSTVCDQAAEPYASWGQMLPRFFDGRVAVANHAESGETYRDSLGRRRIDKIVSQLEPGDWVLLQFGHNDQKQIAAHTGGPFSTYKEEIARHVALIRAAGGIPVIVTPMERWNFDAAGKLQPTLQDYAEAARQAAQQLHVALIDLNAESIRLYEALGPNRSLLAFAHPNAGAVDKTHHNNFGAYELAKCVLGSAHERQLGFAAFIDPTISPFSPDHPDDPARFDLPPTPIITHVRPLGD